MRYLRAIFKQSCYIGVAFLLAIAILIGIDVLLRFTINSPINGAYEIAILLLLTMVFLSFAWVQTNKRHMRMTFVSQKFTGRRGEVLKIITDILIVVFFIAMLWQSTFEAIEAVRFHGYERGLIRIPVVLPTSFMVFGSLLIIIAAVFDIVNGVKGLFLGRREIRHELAPSEETTAI